MSNQDITVFILMQDTGFIYGAEQATIELAEALNQVSGICIRVLLMHELRLGLKSSQLEMVLRQKKLLYRKFDVRSRFSFNVIKQVRHCLEEYPHSILHTVGDKADIHAGVLSLMGCEAPLVTTIHGWLFRRDIKERLYGWLDVQMIKRFSSVVVLSNYYNKYLIGLGISKECINLIPIGVNPNLINEVSLQVQVRKRGDIVFGILGRLSEEKQHAIMLNAFSELIKEGLKTHLIIAGEGPEREKIRSIIVCLGLEPHVTMTGFMERMDFFSQADVLVVCSKIENLPRSVMEAMALQKPVIAAAVGGIPDLVISGENGLLYDPADEKGLETAMRAMAIDKQRCLQMGIKGRKRMTDHFAMTECVQQHVNLYRRLLSIN